MPVVSSRRIYLAHHLGTAKAPTGDIADLKSAGKEGGISAHWSIRAEAVF